MAVPKDWKRFMIVYEQRTIAPSASPTIYTAIMVDQLTGVNYLYAHGGLTPLLDANGKPVVTPVENL